jgi:endonuclease YncB( thermonuclease family)
MARGIIVAGVAEALIVVGVVAAVVGAARMAQHFDEPPLSEPWRCTSLEIIDGDTLVCRRVRVRLAGIDAPEMPGGCEAGRDCVAGDPYAARSALQRLAGAGTTCRSRGEDAYGRIVAGCESAGRDLSCAMIESGHAVRRYGPLRCPPGEPGRWFAPGG